jgi:hypothetical protein
LTFILLLGDGDDNGDDNAAVAVAVAVPTGVEVLSIGEDAIDPYFVIIIKTL